MPKSKLLAKAKSEANEVFRLSNEYLVENDAYEEALELHRKRKAAESALNPLKKGGLKCRTCHP